MSLIEIKNLTKDYGDGKGIFDVNLSIEKGEFFGFVGVNGAGKTTLIRHLMGFLKPQKGNAIIKNLNCWSNSAEIKGLVSYVPGEIAFPDVKSGTEFLKIQSQILGLKDDSYAKYLIKKLQLDPTANLKRMSKGMKQKTALIACFMRDCEIIILDEPTTGLDPLMRSEFVDILKEEKKKGKTVFMSSHVFEEVEDTCDKICVIKEGKIIDVKATKEIHHNNEKQYKLEFITNEEYVKFLKEKFNFIQEKHELNQVIIQVNDKDINEFFGILKNYKIKFISEIKFTLEKYFSNLY